MFRVRILEGGSRKTLPFLRSCLKKASLDGRIDAALCGGDADLLIVPRGALLPGNASTRCLLTVGTSHPGAVSCGLGTSDALSLSSIRSDGVMLSLSRELTTLGGQLLEPQEIPVTVSGGTPEPEAIAAAAGAMLLLGADAEHGLRI